MSDRWAAIVRLLGTRDDHLPVPVRRAAMPAGFVSGVRERACPDCLANGGVLRTCATCGGSGWVSSGSLRIAAADALESDGRRLDPYATEVVLPFGWDVTRHDEARVRDAAIDRLEEQLRPPRSEAELLEEENRRPFGWEVQRRRMYARFDYGRLDAGLELLRTVDVDAYRALHAVFVYGWLAVWTCDCGRESAAAGCGECGRRREEAKLHAPAGAAAKAVERGLVFLDEVLPSPLRAPAPARPPVTRARGKGSPIGVRNSEIVQLVRTGRPPREVAEAYGIGVSTVYAIVKAAGG